MKVGTGLPLVYGARARPYGNGAGAGRSRTGGFTLVELITVMVVMGILSAVAVSRFFDNSVFEAREFADQTRALIRYGQKLAIAQNRPVYVISNGNSFALCFAAACSAGNLVLPPSGSNSGNTVTKAQCKIGGNYVAAWMCEGKPASVTLASSRASEAGASGLFFFDAMGRPYNAADAANPIGTPSTFIPPVAPLVLTFAASGTSAAITIEPETGYVH